MEHTHSECWNFVPGPTGHEGMGSCKKYGYKGIFCAGLCCGNEDLKPIFNTNQK